MAIITRGRDSSGRPVRFDSRMDRKVRMLQARFPKVVVVQSSYSDAEASGNTHEGGGSVDFRTWNLTVKERLAVIKYARTALGIWLWYRTKAQGFDPHMHGVDDGNPTLAPAAKSQVMQARQGLNGLKNRRADDGRPRRVSVKPFKWRRLPKGARYVAVRNVKRRRVGLTSARTYSTMKKGRTMPGYWLVEDPNTGQQFIRGRTFLVPVADLDKVR